MSHTYTDLLGVKTQGQATIRVYSTGKESSSPDEGPGPESSSQTRSYVTIRNLIGSSKKVNPLVLRLKDAEDTPADATFNDKLDIGIQSLESSDGFTIYSARKTEGVPLFTHAGVGSLGSFAATMPEVMSREQSLTQEHYSTGLLSLRLNASRHLGFYRFPCKLESGEKISLNLTNQNDEPVTVHVRGFKDEFPEYSPDNIVGLSTDTLITTQGELIESRTVTAGESTTVVASNDTFKYLVVIIEGSQSKHPNSASAPLYFLTGKLSKSGTASSGSGSTGSDPSPSQPPAQSTPDPGGDVTLSYKTFASIGDMADNNHRQVSLIGELSAYSSTFSRDRLLSSTTFSIATVGYNGIALRQTVFSCRNAAQKRVAPNEALVDYVEEVAAYLYKGALQRQYTADGDTVRQYLMTYGTPIHQIQPGTMVSHASEYYPEFISFIIRGADLKQWYQDIRGRTLELTPELERVQVKLWLSDRAFQLQFDEYEIEVIPPIEMIDGFFQSEDNVRTSVMRRRIEELMEQINAVADKDPYTQVKTLEFNWHNPLNDTKIPTNWTFVVYGQQGLSNDALKAHLRDWILKKSNNPRDGWVIRFPDIFKTTEFVFVPNWSRYAIPNETLSPGMYTPYQDYQEAMLVSRQAVAGEGYTSQHLVRSLGFLGNTYKSVGLLVCGGPENRTEHQYFNQVWPDYLAVSTSSTDFNRMQPSTQNWVNRFHYLMRLAEEATELSDLPAGFSRITRKNYLDKPVTYIAMTERNVQYLVVTKQSMVQLVPSEGLDITPDAIPLTVLPSNRIVLQTAKGNKTLTVDFEVMGGSAPYRYAIAQTDDMEEISVGANTGHSEIRFKEFGTFSFAVTITDSTDTEYVTTYSVQVRP